MFVYGDKEELFFWCSTGNYLIMSPPTTDRHLYPLEGLNCEEHITSHKSTLDK